MSLPRLLSSRMIAARWGCKPQGAARILTTALIPKFRIRSSKTVTTKIGQEVIQFQRSAYSERDVLDLELRQPEPDKLLKWVQFNCYDHKTWFTDKEIQTLEKFILRCNAFFGWGITLTPNIRDLFRAIVLIVKWAIQSDALPAVLDYYKQQYEMRLRDKTTQLAMAEIDNKDEIMKALANIVNTPDDSEIEEEIRRRRRKVKKKYISRSRKLRAIAENALKEIETKRKRSERIEHEERVRLAKLAKAKEEGDWLDFLQLPGVYRPAPKSDTK